MNFMLLKDWLDVSAHASLCGLQLQPVTVQPPPHTLLPTLPEAGRFCTVLQGKSGFCRVLLASAFSMCVETVMAGLTCPGWGGRWQRRHQVKGIDAKERTSQGLASPWLSSMA